MGKTTITIKQKTTPKIGLISEPSTNPPAKKRGRPPKKDVSAKKPIPVKTPVKASVYSLINNSKNTKLSTGLITSMRNTIVQLKINKEDIEYYEKHGNWEGFTLLKSIKNVIREPFAYNNLGSDFNYEQPAQMQFESEEAAATTNKSSNPLGSLIKPIKNKSDEKTTNFFRTETKEDIEKRRNLIINSGVCRKLYKLMTAFNNNEWPNYSPYYCWYCCHPFNNAPVGIPEKITPISENNESRSSEMKYVFSLYGNFCSYNCAARYLNPCNVDDNAALITNLDLSREDEKAEQIQLLELLCYMETNLEINEKIKLAPSRLSLKAFGGKLTIEEFRENFDQHDEYHIYKAPLVPIIYQLEESTGLNYDSKPKKVKKIDYKRIERACKELNKQQKQLKENSLITKILQSNAANKNLNKEKGRIRQEGCKSDIR